MIRIKPLTFFFLISVVCNSALHADSLYCPNTAAYIHTGMDQATVEQKCGAPAKKEEGRGHMKETGQVEQWFYQMASTLTGTSGNLTVIFTVSDNKVSRIKIAGESVESTTLCNQDKTVHVGDSTVTLLNHCSEPNFKNRTNETTHSDEEHTVSVWTYEFNPYHPKTTLQFVDGVLTSIE